MHVIRIHLHKCISVYVNTVQKTCILINGVIILYQNQWPPVEFYRLLSLCRTIFLRSSLYDDIANHTTLFYYSNAFSFNVSQYSFPYPTKISVFAGMFLSATIKTLFFFIMYSALLLIPLIFIGPFASFAK